MKIDTLAPTYINFAELCEVGPIEGGEAQQRILQVQQPARVSLQHYVWGMEVAIWKTFLVQEL